MSKAKLRVHFIQQIIQNDLNIGKHANIVTRFPPEPNGYLHIGHAKSICLNFGLAETFGGKCNLRFDDTNPEKEDEEYVQSIQQDVAWLGYDWGDKIHYSSDYFVELYAFAIELIDQGLAYVDSQDAETIRDKRGTLTQAGIDSPHRQRSVAENKTLFAQMRLGKFANGAHVLRAKIDMASPNINMRDPVLYRIRHLPHQRSGAQWCIYPMYDYTHCISDALEGVTHSLCTLEFADHRPLYDWILAHVSVPTLPRQIEFSRLNLDYTVMSKRLLTQLVDLGKVSGWDDPRMPTISGLKRRGYTPDSIREFAQRVGITKKINLVEFASLESCIRDELDPSAKRVMAVLNPLKVTLTNYPDASHPEDWEMLNARNHPKDATLGMRTIPFSKTLYIERDDFMLEPSAQFFRLAPGREVRLRYAYYIKCNEVICNAAGEPTELLCTYDPATKGGSAPDGRKVKATLHWVSAATAIDAEVRLYDRLFMTAQPLADKNNAFTDGINPESLITLAQCKLEPSLHQAKSEEHFQFERLGYFITDSRDHSSTCPVFNRTVTLRDTWAKLNS